MLQKPSATSKAKEHTACSEWRLHQWKTGEIELLMKEIRHIQRKLNKPKKPKKSIEDISRIFSKLIMEGKYQPPSNSSTKKVQVVYLS